MFSPKLVFLFCLTALAVDAGSNDNLVAVIQVFRHGQRTPVSFYKNDPYSGSDYWGGLDSGQLTNEGKRQQYALGQFTRARYAGWLPAQYTNKDIYAQTTDVDRTHMSAQSNIYGLYPASITQKWHSSSDWQPIPIHPADPKIFNGSPSSCTAYYTERTNLLVTDVEYLALDSTYAALYKYLTNNSGNNVTSFNEIHTIFDDLKIESDVGFSLPSWTSIVHPSPLYELAGYLFESYSHNTKMKRLGTGPLLYTWMEYFEAMTNDTTSNPKFQMYSGHDTNIASVLNSLGYFSPPFPPGFASSIYLELRQTSYGSYYINTFLRNDGKFTQFSINGCALDCPLATVKSLLADILVDVDTRDAECLL